MWKKWWIWVAAAIIIILVWQTISGWSLSGKLCNMLVNQIQTDQSNIIKEKDKWISDCEKEISNLQTKLVSVVAENQRLKGKVNEIQSRRENIVVPNDPAGIISDLHKMGFSSEHYRKN
jgi:peptidoglycan hydrolase CwlO-like protein